jgi:predicted transcriptional regulator
MDKEEVKKKIYETVEKSVGKKKLKSSDIQKLVSAELGITRDDVKDALKDLVDDGSLIYTYFGGSFVEIPPKQ